MAKLTVNNIGSGYLSTTALNDNFDLIETALENTLSRDGTGPNQMEASLDMNGNLILNQGNPIAISGFTWEGPWVALTTYSIGDIVEYDGVAYIAITNHTAGATFVIGSDWQLFASAAFPSQTGNTGEFLQTDGSSLSWQMPDALEVSFIQAGTGAVARTMQAKGLESVSVEDFGAVGDGTTDDTSAITLAIDSGRRVKLLRGKTYAVTGLELASLSNFDLYGGGKLTLINTSNKPVIKLTDCSNFTINGLQIDGNSAGQNEAVDRNKGTGISLLQCTNWIITRCRINDNYSGAGILTIDNGTTSTELDTNGEVSFNIVTNSGKVGGTLLSDGMFINSDNTLVFGNTIQTCTDYGIAGDYSHKLQIHGNKIKNVLVGIGILGAFDWDVSGNTIDGAGLGIAITLSGNPAVAPYVSDGVTIRGNTILNITRDASGTPNGDGIFVDTSADNVSIDGNIIKTAYRGVASDAPGTRIIGNNIDTTVDRGIFNSGAGSITDVNRVVNAGAANYYGTTQANKTVFDDGVPDAVDISVFTNGWSNFGAPYDNAGYYRQGGRVYLFGSIKDAAPVAGEPAFQLPIYYRPVSTIYFIVADASATGVFSVDANGYVTYRAGTGTSVNLDQISFVVA